MLGLVSQMHMWKYDAPVGKVLRAANFAGGQSARLVILAANINIGAVGYAANEYKNDIMLQTRGDVFAQKKPSKPALPQSHASISS